MLLFRVITPILWYWAVRDMAGDSPRKARPGIAAIAAALAAGLFSLLLNAVSIEYTYTGVFVYHLIVYWLPLLCLSPLLLLTVKRLRHASGIPFMSALSGQGGVIIAVVWLDTLLYDGIWEPSSLFIFPVLALVLGVLPPLLFSCVYERWGKFVRHSVWLILAAAGAAAAAVQMLFHIRRWLLGGFALAFVLCAVVISAIYIIRSSRPTVITAAEDE